MVQVETRAEAPSDCAALETVINAAFGPGRFAKTSERVRERAQHVLAWSRVALLAGRPIGCCRAYLTRLGEGAVGFLGPLAVEEGFRGSGLARRLVSEAVEASRDAGLPLVVVGPERLFAPMGFRRAAPGEVSFPGPVDPARLLYRPADI